MRDYKKARESMQTSEYTIYARVDPRDNAVCYIGFTSDLKVRTQQLLRLPGENKRLDAWIRELQVLGLIPRTEELETVVSWKAAME